MNVHVSPTPEALGVDIAQKLTVLAREAVRERGEFHVALSGGSTPAHLYRAWRDLPVSEDDWRWTFVYFSDERTVPPASPDSNYRLAHDELLRHVPIPESQVRRLKGELDPRDAALEYAQQLPTRLDVVLLGMGTDGHTASLFPGTAALDAPGRVVANHVPQLDTWRLTFTFGEINAARERWVMATGANKSSVLREIQLGAGRYPVERVLDPVWFIDAAAAADLTR